MQETVDLNEVKSVFPYGQTCFEVFPINSSPTLTGSVEGMCSVHAEGSANSDKLHACVRRWSQEVYAAKVGLQLLSLVIKMMICSLQWQQ